LLQHAANQVWTKYWLDPGEVYIIAHILDPQLKMAFLSDYVNKDAAAAHRRLFIQTYSHVYNRRQSAADGLASSAQQGAAATTSTQGPGV